MIKIFYAENTRDVGMNLSWLIDELLQHSVRLFFYFSEHCEQRKSWIYENFFTSKYVKKRISNIVI